jgi:3-hydroxyisobutyrate dehydrogenase
MTNVAFLGLGAMGGRMAAHLLKAGHIVTVWNRDVAKAKALAIQGAVIGATPRAASQGADVVIAMLRDDPASSDVWLDAETGALGGMSVNSLAVECSTLSPGYVERLAQLSATAGVAFLDAPVIGSRPQADAAELIFVVGGEVNALARAETVLKTMGSAAYHVGPTGSGSLVKLAANALFGIQVAALAEILGFLRKRMGDPARMIEVLGMTPVMSPSAKGAAASILAGAFAPLFPVDLVEKDLGYFHDLAAGDNASMPLLDSTRAVIEVAVRKGLGNDNLTGIARLYR